MKEALLVIDAQKIYSLEASDYCVENCTTIVDNINALIKAFKKRGDLIVYIKHEHNPDGSDSGRMFDFTGQTGDIEFQRGTEETEFIDALIVNEGSPIITKTRYDAFIFTTLDEILKANEIKKVIVTGFMTNFCCESTAKHAHDIDYYVDFVVDATGTPGTEKLSPVETINATIATLETGYAMIISTVDVT